MFARSSYPAGVPCWVDIMQPDLDATMAFYGELFGWTFEVRTPEAAPQRYAYARLNEMVVGGVGGPPLGDVESAGWTTYVSVDSADETAGLVQANGGRVLEAPTDIPHSGRSAVCADPFGAVFGLWQAAENRGSQLVNAPGSWNFSDLNVGDPAGAERFYRAVFGWESDQLEMGAGQKTRMFRVAGYGDFLAESDPEIRSRQEAEQAPPGFSDAVALMNPIAADGAVDAQAYWGVTFGIADADESFARATGLGARVVTPLFDTEYTRMGTVKDPQGAVFTLSQYRPPEAS